MKVLFNNLEGDDKRLILEEDSICGDSNLARMLVIDAGTAIPEEPEEAEFSVFLEHKL